MGILDWFFARRKVKASNTNVAPSKAVSISPLRDTKNARGCKICGSRSSSRDSRKLLIKARQDNDMQTVLFDDYEKLSLSVLNDLGCNITELQHMRHDIWVCNECFSTKVLPLVEGQLNNAVQAIKKEIDKGHSLGAHTPDSVITAAGRLGAQNAFPALVRLYTSAQKNKVGNTSRLQFGIISLAKSQLESNLKNAADFSPEELSALSSCLVDLLDDPLTSTYLDYLCSFLKCGVAFPNRDVLIERVESRGSKLAVRVSSWRPNYLSADEAERTIRKSIQSNDEVLKLLKDAGRETA